MGPGVIPAGQVPASGLMPPDSYATQPGKDWELGADGDLTVRATVYEGRVLGDTLEARPAGGSWAPLAVVPGIGVRPAFTFDQLMRPVVAYKLDDDTAPSTGYLRWYDQVLGGFDTLSVATVTSPWVSFDYWPDPQATVAEIIWLYVRAGTVFYRRQADRFTVEYTWGALPAGTSRITGAGLGRNWRFHIRCGN